LNPGFCGKWFGRSKKLRSVLGAKALTDNSRSWFVLHHGQYSFILSIEESFVDEVQHILEVLKA
jgi:hypothetical protein